MNKENRIEKIENELPLIDFSEGKPTPIWDNKVILVEQMEQLNIPGLGIAVIDNCEIDWIKHYGIKDILSKEKVTMETIFEAGSSSKMLTAIVALKLVEEGILELDENVNKRLKTWKIPKTEYTEKTKITLRHLLTHTAGINRPDSMFEVEKNGQPSINEVLNGIIPAINDPVKVEFEPGTKFQYSNLGYIIIEKLVEDVKGKKFSKMVKKFIFEPLNMKNSSYGYPSEVIKKKAILPHNEKGEAKESGMHPTITGPAGLMTTPRDFSKFIIEIMLAYQGRSEKILSQTMVREMFSPEWEFKPEKLFGLFTHQGLGVALIATEEELTFIQPGTNSPGAVCMMAGNPKSGKGLIVMSNGIQAEYLHIQILYAITKEYNWKLGY